MFHILVVDDDKHTRRLLQAVLEAENYTVCTAADGVEALSVMEREHIDLAVLDIMMPNMDGYEFTKTLREAQNNPRRLSSGSCFAEIIRIGRLFYASRRVFVNS